MNIGNCYGALEWRSLRFEMEWLAECDNFQGNTVVNYTDAETPYIRIIEHKHFDYGCQSGTVVTREYPEAFGEGKEPYYTANDGRNAALYDCYRQLAGREGKVLLFGGRLGEYRYYNMDEVVRRALDLGASLLIEDTQKS